MIPAPATRRERRRRCTALLLSVFVSLLLTAPAHGETSEPPPAEADAEKAPAAPGATDPGDADEPESSPLPGLGALDGLIVDLDAPHTGCVPARVDLELVALADLARPQSAGHYGAVAGK